MPYTPTSPEVFLLISFIYYVFYEFAVVSPHNKEKELELLEEHSSTMRDFYQSSAGKAVRIAVYSINVVIAFVLLLILFQNVMWGLIIFVLHQVYFFRKKESRRKREIFMIYTLYHVPFYLTVGLTLMNGGLF